MHTFWQMSIYLNFCLIEISEYRTNVLLNATKLNSLLGSPHFNLALAENRLFIVNSYGRSASVLNILGNEGASILQA